MHMDLRMSASSLVICTKLGIFIQASYIPASTSESVGREMGPRYASLFSNPFFRVHSMPAF
jgi:hypothetical protein